MTEEDQKRLADLQAIVAEDPKCFTENENTARRLLKEGATTKQMAVILRCNMATVRNYLKRRQRRIDRARQMITNIHESYANARENQDLRIAYTDKGNASEILKLLLPHINQIKELTK